MPAPLREPQASLSPGLGTQLAWPWFGQDTGPLCQSLLTGHTLTSTSLAREPLGSATVKPVRAAKPFNQLKKSREMSPSCLPLSPADKKTLRGAEDRAAPCAISPGKTSECA